MRSSNRLFPPAVEKERQAQLTEDRTCDKGHGRITRRHLQASRRLAGHLNWPGLQQVCRIERVTKTNGKTTTEIAYAITSLSAQQANATQLLAFNRGHWKIESHHWVRDVTFGEDACREKRGHLSQNLATLRNACLNLLSLEQRKGIASTLRHFSWHAENLLKFLRILKN